MLLRRGRSVWRDRACKASSTGRPERTRVANWRVISARSTALMRGWKKLRWRAPLAVGEVQQRERRPALFAELLADLSRRVGLEYALAFLAAAVERGVFIGAHVKKRARLSRGRAGQTWHRSGACVYSY